MTTTITPDEIRAKCRNAHPVDALVLLKCAEEIERLQGELAGVVAHRDSETRWAAQYKAERDEARERIAGLGGERQ